MPYLNRIINSYSPLTTHNSLFTTHKIMQIIIADNYNELSTKAADEVIRLMQSCKHPLLCVASGDSPAGLYKNIVERVTKKQLDVNGWSFVGLDEWVGMNGADEGSCRYHLNKQLFNAINITNNNFSFF